MGGPIYLDQREATVSLWLSDLFDTPVSGNFLGAYPCKVQTSWTPDIESTSNVTSWILTADNSVVHTTFHDSGSYRTSDTVTFNATSLLQYSFESSLKVDVGGCSKQYYIPIFN